MVDIRPTASAYGEQFFQQLDQSSGPSADVVVPLLIELFEPRSVVDIGCGTGVWLTRFRDRGVGDVLGVDGPWVDPRELKIPPALFTAAELNSNFTIDRRFDLALSLETAEHISPEFAEAFVQRLTDLSDVVVFSAAIPHQGGTCHLNEQWPDYWVRLFANVGYQAIDCIRGQIWNDQRVAWWFCQNMLVFARAERVARDHGLRQIADRAPAQVLPLVHPRKFLETVAELRAVSEASRSSVSSAIRRLGGVFERRVKGGA
jgi:SAM-dependent methyltransferase